MPYRNDLTLVRTLLVSVLIGLLLVREGRAETRTEAARAQVERISFAVRSDGQGYVVRVHAAGRISAYSEPHRTGTNELEWTLFNTELARSYRDASALGPVRRYTAHTRQGHLVLRFELRPDASVEATAYRDRATEDLLLGLTYTDAPPAMPTPADPPVAHASTEEEAVRSGWSGRSSSAAAGSSSAGERWRLNTVVIDAGHGGKDPGAQAYGLREKDITLAIARKLGAYIKERMEDVRVVYTREDDRFVTLRDRGHIANKAGGKLFVSIHVNAARNRAAHGTETYFLGTHKTEAAKKVMERENSVVRLEENPEQYERFDEQELIVQALAQSAYMRQSEHLAEAVQQQFEERVQRQNRGVKQAGFWVLWGASMPAILVETGFITNRSEAAFLKSERGQDYLASAIFRAIRDFRAEYEKGLNLSASE